MKSLNKYPRIGDVYQIKFEGSKNVQRGWRPGIIIQNNIGNKFSPNVIALPMTSVIKNEHQPTHVFLPADETGLKLDSIVLCENPETVPKAFIGEYITNIPRDYMSKIAEALTLSMPLISFLNEKEVSNIWYKTSKLVLTL